ncbi:MAG: selenium-dependent xanthine dehydrogenase [Phycisphaerales bacterium]|nr:MAG: selenium-dependent xanthine dehydrogenase [Phycisphaerales bacterium]
MASQHHDTPASELTGQVVSFELNAQSVSVRALAGQSLLDVLRDEFGIVSPKRGCAPQGQCGACTVLVDGRPRLSCAMPASKVAGRRVTTLEGLPAEIRGQLAESFVRSGACQCGFCIPGIAMRTVALVEQNPTPARDEIARGLRRHLCRCTGYAKIIDGVELFARVRRGEAMAEPDTTGRVGTRMDRYRGRELVLGSFRFIDDVDVPGSLYAALRFSDHPRALVKGIDDRPACAQDGVVRVITAGDVPGERCVGLIEQDWPILVAVGEETRCTGDVLAVVVARDRRTARAAAGAIVVDYEVRTPVTSPEDALKADAPRIHPARADGNLLSRSIVRRGSVEAAFASSAHVVEHMYTTQRVEHMFLEPEACIAMPWSPDDDGARRLKVLSQGQGVFDDRRQIASVLGWDADRIQVQLVSNGGAFGGKEDLSIQAQTALAAVLCRQPVKCTLTRTESFRLHPKRHPVRIHMRAGCDADGRLTAVRARIVGDTGAYASVGGKVLERAAGHATGPYRVPNVDIESSAVYTNNPPGGAMRGFGVNHVAFAMEGMLDLLADKVGIDGWEVRWRNALDQGDTFCTGQKLTKPFGLKKTLLAVRDTYRGEKYAGIACGVKNVGLGTGAPDLGKAVLTVDADDHVTIRTGFTEMGQGLFTVCIQTACQETRLPPGVFRVTTDTSADVDCGQTTASRGTVLAGLAVQQAARNLRADLDAGKTLTDLVGRQYRGDYACTYTTKLGADVPDPKTHLTYGFATQVVSLDDDGRLKKVVAAHDVGKVINPTLLEGQIEGAIHMGLGYALTEEFVVEGGCVQSKDVNSLGILRAHDMPRVEVIFIEEPDPETPYGARGVGEIGLVPTAPAVAGALAAFDGIRRTRLPMRDSPAARAIMDPRWQPSRPSTA